MSREYDVHVAPIFGGRRAFAGPVGRIVEVVRNLGRPEASRVAIVDIAFHGLAQPGRTAGGVGFPAGREDDGASHRNMDWGLRSTGSLEGNDVFFQRLRMALDTLRLLVDGSEMLHEAFLSEK